MGIYQTPGFTPRQAAGTAFSPTASPSFTPYQAPASVAGRIRPGTQIMEKNLTTRASTIGQKYQPQRTAQIGNTRAQLKRYGGYNVADDGSVSTDPNAAPGQAYKDAYGQGRDAANAGGMMDSSFAAKSIGAAFGRLSAEAQQIVTQHAVSFNQIIGQEAADFDEINQALMQLYGDEAQYMLDNPPPPPEPTAPAAPAAGSTAAATQAPAGVSQGAMSPGFRIVGGGNVMTTYSKADLTPANRLKLQKQFPGFQIAISGDGRVVMKKVS